MTAKPVEVQQKYLIGLCTRQDKGEHSYSIEPDRMSRAAGYARGICRATGETFDELLTRLHISRQCRDKMIEHSKKLAQDGSWTDVSPHDILVQRIVAVEAWQPEQLELLRSVAASNERIAAALERLSPPVAAPPADDIEQPGDDRPDFA